MTHDYHPHVWAPEAGVHDGPVLADGCPRCGEHAEQPELSLDAHRQRRLLRILSDGGPFQSDNDRRAAGRLVVAGVEVRR